MSEIFFTIGCYMIFAIATFFGLAIGFGIFWLLTTTTEE